MSEPNSPLNSQEHSSNESSLNWWNPFPDLSEETDLVEQDSTSLLHADSSPASHQTNVKNADAKNASLENFPTPDRPTDRPTTEADAPANGAHVAVIAAWSEGIANQTDPPNLADLISLIQELNQCNGVLLDRVSQLEEALERSQQALQVQGKRSTEPPVVPHQAEDLTTAQAQIANLFSQLEFAHQANQRQQILTETLTAGLESSQERVAQLEREAALLQQRYNEQSQRLVQSEGSCRDLQARLQRQQRYTLQFKAALEKCLEMPAPQYEGSETIAPPTDVLSLPKAQQIQPWSTPGQTVDPTLPWMKLHAGSETSEDAEEALDVADLFAALEMTEQELIAAEPERAADEPVLPSPLKMASLHLPTFTETTAQTTAEPVNLSQDAESIEPQTIETGSEQGVRINEAALDEPLPSPDTLPAPISYNLKAKDESVIDPALIEHLSTTVQPLADMLAEAMLAVTQPAHPDSVHSDHHLAVSSLDAPQAAEPSIETTEALVDEVMICDPDALLASAMNEAEDALWQDLARLIEVSTEDVVKASLSGDLAAFESINFGAIEAKPDVQSQPDRSTPAADSVPQMPAMSVASQPTTQPVALSTGALTDDAETESSDPNSSEDLSPLSTSLSWPSPLLNPLRPPKGKRSLSHVELPSFVRQEPSNPIVT